MRVYECYMFRQLAVATAFLTFTLSVIILMTQSLRFLELVLESGATASAFFVLSLLAIPRFFEIITPIALMGAVTFIYNRLTMDSELIVWRASGRSPMQMAKPALILAGCVSVFLFVTTSWLGPVSLSTLQKMRQTIKAEYSVLLFREGVFTTLGKNITVYVRNKGQDGQMQGLLIHDTRPENKNPVTIVARQGNLLATEDAQSIVVEDGVRQSFDPERGTYDRLVFTRYVLDVPEAATPVNQRWQEPDERTLFELFHPDFANSLDRENKNDFVLEIHRRLISPFLAPGFVLTALSFLLLGSVKRKGQTEKIIMAVASIILLQGLYLGAFNLAQQNWIGLILMYFVVFGPILLGFFMLSPLSEALRRRLFYKRSPSPGLSAQGEA